MTEDGAIPSVPPTMNEMVKDIQKELKKRYLMGKHLKESMGWLGIETRLLTIWKGKDDCLVEVHIKDNEEGFFLIIYHLDLKGTREINDIDEELQLAAELVEEFTEEWLESHPDDELVWDWLGD